MCIRAYINSIVFIFSAVMLAGCKGAISSFLSIGDTTTISIETQSDSSASGFDASSLVAASANEHEIGTDKTLLVVVRDLNGNYVKTTEGEWSVDDSSVISSNCIKSKRKNCSISGLKSGSTKVSVTVDNKTASATISIKPRTKLVLGAPDAKSVPKYQFGLDNPRGVYKAGNKFFIAEEVGRIKIYNSMPTSNETKPDIVLGHKSDSTTHDSIVDPVGPSSLGDDVNGIWSDGNRILVVDEEYNRVLLWNSFPTSNNAPADVVIGQPNFTSTTANTGGISASTLDDPKGVFSDGTKIFIADRSNNRVLIWNSFPTTNGKAADLVLGQPDFTSTTANNGGVSAQSIDTPFSVWANESIVGVADSGNNRVLLWFAHPTANQSPAHVVLGQPNMTSNTADNGGIGGNTLDAPSHMHYNGTQFAVTDNDNNRILLWNSFPTTNGKNANFVLGQPNFTSSGNGTSSTAISDPRGVFLGSSEIIVADRDNERIMIWNSFPTTNGAAADLVLGQSDFTGKEDYGAPAPTSSSIWNPEFLTFAGEKLIVPTRKGHRILIWNKTPEDFNTPADLVLGQPDFTTRAKNTGGVSARSLNTPKGVAWDGQHLIVADSVNHRVLIWNSFPTTNYQPADLVLGQPNFTSSSSNNGGRSAQTMNLPTSVATDGTRLFVTDFSNNRVLIWNTFPTANQQAADLVLGQPNFTSGSSNNGGRSAQTFFLPFSVNLVGTSLYVADSFNNRVLVWSSLPTTIQQAANFVLGQPDMTSGSGNNGGLSAKTLKRPEHIFSMDNQLWVTDSGNHRILRWNAIPTTTQQEANAVLGQPDITSGSPNAGAGVVSFDGFYQPSSYFKDQSGRSYVVDEDNSRIVINRKPSF